MMRYVLRWGRRLWCAHTEEAVERICGDAINLLGCRELRTCLACGRIRRHKIL